MTYSVKEIFKTLQGEGAQTGKTAVFCRFSGCNLWSGREKDRKNAICNFCDTDFIGTNGKNGGKFKNAEILAEIINKEWGSDYKSIHKYVVFTGGEPLLQLDHALVNAVKNLGFQIAIETNGTINIDLSIDWICVSPKSYDKLVVTSGDEIKLIYPQNHLHPSLFENLKFKHFFLQPMYNNEIDNNIELTVNFCMNNAKWKLSLQTHKLIGIQ
ncbi:7-carboxy-7-deazaguanine synthase [Candidatus Kinetoplastibacterium sorsogonicusi]|uniref:7-carboxy-7-deazaguanine synthase n=1 Tax=Candidatus Kinetoplastidibacterium kentomonadis TaxID=1576550 RepID=A0A3Q8ERF4_9PROT|nr:7-carboxy-7-deazaguanine synthase [Candidatus Kinetoplastibacterium sorsogonicusi]AWD32369.1 7-carboxy-7-deazaguanine synthase [Candidatus Kinetoplastibacterium sorsogonicusi]